MERQKLEQLLKEHRSIREIATAAHVSYTTVRYWLRRFELKSEYSFETPIIMVFKAKCLNCEKQVRRKPNIYCSIKCQHQFKRKCKVENGERDSRLLKKYFMDTREHRCEICGIVKWMGKVAPLELDHQDGNSDNNELENLRLICPNCHAQTDSYKGRNSGKGRHYRRIRYAQGKSY